MQGRAGSVIVILALAGAPLILACGQFLGVDDDDPATGQGPSNPTNADASTATGVVEITADSGIEILEDNDAQAPEPCATVDLATDPRNCGVCGNECGVGSVCVAGACQVSTMICGAPGEISCDNSTCIDAQKDSLNCGGCGNVCNGGCNAGFCDKVVFLTPNAFPASGFGGVAGADAKCQLLAVKAGLKGMFRAWISDETTSPLTRFSQNTADSTGGYFLVDGKRVADSAKTLIQSGPLTPINLTINGNAVANTPVWTATTANALAAASHCDNWTAATNSDVLVGNTGAKLSATWTATPATCKLTGALLYCFEQDR